MTDKIDNAQRTAAKIAEHDFIFSRVQQPCLIRTRRRFENPAGHWGKIISRARCG